MIIKEKQYASKCLHTAFLLLRNALISILLELQRSSAEYEFTVRRTL